MPKKRDRNRSQYSPGSSQIFPSIGPQNGAASAQINYAPARDRRIMPHGSRKRYSFAVHCKLKFSPQNPSDGSRLPRLADKRQIKHAIAHWMHVHIFGSDVHIFASDVHFFGALCDFRGNNDMKFHLLSVIFLTALTGSLSTEANAQRGLTNGPSADRPASADAVVAQRDQPPVSIPAKSFGIARRVPNSWWFHRVTSRWGRMTRPMKSRNIRS